MNKVLDRRAGRITLGIVSADGQDLVAGLVDGDNVRQLDACRLAVHAHVLEAVEVQLNMHLEQSADIVCVRRTRGALQLVDLLLDLVALLVGATGQLYVAVEPRNLELANLVVGHLQNMRDPRCADQVSCRVRNHDVLRRDKLGHRPLLGGVKVDLLEGRA